jgi:hypothetical protein
MKPETAANTDAELERALQPGSGSRASGSCWLQHALGNQ